MPSIIRAIQRHFPITSIVGSTDTIDGAKTLARRHLERTGRAVCIQPSAVGFTVVEVR